jgi:hypothetical protein
VLGGIDILVNNAHPVQHGAGGGDGAAQVDRDDLVPGFFGRVDESSMTSMPALLTSGRPLTGPSQPG